MSSTPTGEHSTTSDHPSVQTTTFRPDRLNLIGAVVMFLICLIFVGYNPRYFFWVPLLPILFAVWVLRARTVVSDSGIKAFYLFRPARSLSWSEFRALRFNRAGKAFAACGDGSAPRSFREDRRSNVYLPGITFNTLPKLAEATHGLIPDPVTAGKNRAHDDITTVDRDGYAVIKSNEEAALENNARAVAEEIARRKASGTFPDDEATKPGTRAPHTQGGTGGTGTAGSAGGTSGTSRAAREPLGKGESASHDDHA